MVVVSLGYIKLLNCLVFLFSVMFVGGASFLFLASPCTGRTLASDADHRRPLEPAAGVEGHAADEVEVVPVPANKVGHTHVRLAIQHAAPPGRGNPRN
jgi:hypothetical protein